MNALHGECKMTGGKLVIVALEVIDHRLAAVRIHGDFFLHPEAKSSETLKSVADSLNGSPSDLSVEAFASRINAAIPFGVELLGTSPEAIAVALRRAIDSDTDAPVAPALNRIGSFNSTEIERLTSEWKTLPWRLIPERGLSPAMNVALDEVLTDEVANKRSNPILRFWKWTQPAVILGRCQSVSNEIDLAEARKRDLQIVRRMTGGGAMFLQPHGAITYSLYFPETLVEGLSIRQSYEVCEAWLISGLRELGVDAHHIPINDIACGEGKIGGAAQARRKGVVLHHTTLAYDMDPGEMVQVLRIGREKLRDKGVASAAKRVSPLVRQTGLSREAIAQHLFASFQKRFGGTESELTEAELLASEKLVETKYGTAEWTQEYK